MKMSKVLALVNPRAYFLALAAAVKKCGLMNRWILFRPPPHPRFLIRAVNEVVPFIRAAANGINLNGGIYIIPSLYAELRESEKIYRHPLPNSWREFNQLPSIQEVNERWGLLQKHV
jgi:hypothetical protein